MSTPTTTVEVLFATIGTATMIFDDPVRGVWDDVYEWSGDTWQDMTDRVRSVTYRRGRSRAQDRATPATGAVVFDNRDRALDPFNTGSDYSGAVQPRRPLRVRTNGVDQFTGHIADWSLDYSLDQDSTASAQLSDGLAILARQSVEGLAVGTATTSARVAAVLDYAPVAWPASMRDIASGGVSLAAGTATGNALAYLQQVETVEAGSLFVDAAGILTFTTRPNVGTATAYDAAISYDSAVPYASVYVPPTTDLGLTDELADPTDSPYMGISVERGMDLLANSVTVNRGTATPITASDSDSQDEYDIVELTIDGAILADDAAGTALATHMVRRFAWPEPRVSQVMVNLRGVPDAALGRVLSLDIGDVVPVTFTPNGIGAPIEGFARVEGVEAAIGRDITHVKTFQLSTAQGA